MLYLDETPRVEVGVERLEPFTLRDPVVESALPGGPVAMTVHHGPYAGLDDAHAAVHTWAEREDRTLAGPRWEVYGHVEPANEFVTIEIYYLLA
jgi:effector-binding domain-containing protein